MQFGEICAQTFKIAYANFVNIVLVNCAPGSLFTNHFENSREKLEDSVSNLSQENSIILIRVLLTPICRLQMLEIHIILKPPFDKK